ncbi:MAG: nucleotidyltransferase family protein [Halobellus sp.]|uniref:type VII toxin-antitoxin system MntA family adenylyltransferase antitoxin n=1 Tax=Halobellus sp. TaxID=1979212 RepID=UPI0035D5053E
MKTVESTPIDPSFDLDTLGDVLREHPVRLAILFGSHATGRTHPESDVDLAVEFESQRPSDPEYNEVFFGLSADFSDALGTDDVDLVDLHAASPELVSAVFEHGILLVGDPTHAEELRRRLSATGKESQSPRERLDAALERIDAHLDGGQTGVPAAGDSDSDSDE